MLNLNNTFTWRPEGNVVRADGNTTFIFGRLIEKEETLEAMDSHDIVDGDTPGAIDEETHQKQIEA